MSEAARPSKTSTSRKSKSTELPARDLAGRLNGGRHTLFVRVYYEDTDALGMVYYANYFKFLERGRTDMLRLMGIGRHDFAPQDGQDLFVVRRCVIDFLAPARLDDVLEIRTAVAAVGGASLDLNQSVVRDGTELVTARIKAACIDSDGRLKRLSPKIRQKLHELMAEVQQKAGANA
jgi:acyl-CoA thioester hydrolase